MTDVPPNEPSDPEPTAPQYVLSERQRAVCQFLGWIAAASTLYSIGILFRHGWSWWYGLDLLFYPTIAFVLLRMAKATLPEREQSSEYGE